MAFLQTRLLLKGSTLKVQNLLQEQILSFWSRALSKGREHIPSFSFVSSVDLAMSRSYSSTVLYKNAGMRRLC